MAVTFPYVNNFRLCFPSHKVAEMKILIAAVMAVCISACGSRPVRPATPTPDMVQDYSATYSACLAHYIPQVDDGQSDAATVARGLTGFCTAEFDSLINFSSRAEKPRFREALLQRARADKVSFILPIVLHARNARLPKPQ
jgi:hypothetical protein